MVKAFCVMINKIGIKHKNRITNGGSELLTFKQKYYQNKGKSDLTGKFYKLENVVAWQFAHALPKGTYPKYRNNVNNIVFVDNVEQHHRVDSVIAGEKFYVMELVDNWKLIPRIKEKWDFYLTQKK